MAGLRSHHQWDEIRSEPCTVTLYYRCYFSWENDPPLSFFKALVWQNRRQAATWPSNSARLLFLLRDDPPLSSASALAWQNRKEIEVAPSAGDRGRNELISTVWCALSPDALSSAFSLRISLATQNSIKREKKEEWNPNTGEKKKKITIDYQFQCWGLINKSHFAVITVLTSEWIVITPPSGLRYNQRFLERSQCAKVSVV